VTEVAWPFLIGRTRTQDHRFVVIPAFMENASLASALRADTDGDPGQPEAALVREIRVPLEQPVTAVYQVRTATAEDYGLPGDGLLTDEHGRPILLTEGLVLRRAASTVINDGLPRAALDQAHALVTPAYRAFWAEDSQFARQTGQVFSLPSDNLSGPQLLLKPVNLATGLTTILTTEGEILDTPGKHGRSRVRTATIIGVVIFLATLVLVAVAVVAIHLLGLHW
jgi:hypothetical protein